MGKDLKGKELGVGITQQKNGLYNAGFVDKLGTIENAIIEILAKLLEKCFSLM